MKKVIITVICVILALSVIGCSSQSKMEETASYDMENSAASAAGMTTEEYMTDTYAAEAYTEEAMAEEPAPAEDGGSSTGAGDLGIADIPDTDRKLVYSASYSINTENFSKDYDKIMNLVSAQNGYIEYESTEGTAPKSTGDSGRYSSFTIRIPVENYNAFLTALSGVGETASKSLNTDDLSDQYYDTDSRIALLEERKERLMGHLAAATKMDDIIALEDEISECINELDALKGSKKGMDKLVEYATVNINLNEVVSIAAIDAPEKSTGEKAGEALAMGFEGVGEFFKGFAVVIAAIFPALLVAAVVAVAVVLIIKLVRKLKKNAADRKQKTE